MEGRVGSKERKCEDGGSERVVGRLGMKEDKGMKLCGKQLGFFTHCFFFSG